MGGCNSANSIAVIPTAHISHLKSYPPFLSTAATSGAILKQTNTLSQLDQLSYEPIRVMVCALWQEYHMMHPDHYPCCWWR